MKFKRVMVLASVIVLMLTSVIGCSKKEEVTKEGVTKADTKSGVGVNKEENNLNPEGLPILKEKETFKIAVIDNSPVMDAAERPCVIQGEEDTNIHIEWMEIPKSSWNEKINIMFASGNLPDAIIGKVNAGINYPQLTPLDDYLAKYAPHVNAFFDTRDEYPKILKALDGNIYTLPGGDESFENQLDSQLFINKAWLDKLGMSMPTTTEEFYQCLKAFKEKDPNGNGEADEIPFIFNEIWGFGTTIENLFGSFGVLENDMHVFVEDGQVIFSPREQGYYDALKWFNQLFAQGLIDPDSFSLSSDQYMSKGKNKDIIGAHVNYAANQTVGNMGNENFAYVLPLKGPNGDQMVSLNYAARTEGFAITTACKNPAALVRWYDYLNSDLKMAMEWGRGQEGIGWEYSDDTKEKVWLLKNNKPEEYESFGKWRNAITFAGQTPSLWRLEYDMRKIDKPGQGKFYEQSNKRLAVQNSIPYGVYSLTPGFVSTEQSQKRSLLLTDIDIYLKKFVADSIINGIDDAKWEKHLKTLKDLRVDEYVAICQESEDRLN